jgi:hypothetical protein
VVSTYLFVEQRIFPGHRDPSYGTRLSGTVPSRARCGLRPSGARHVWASAALVRVRSAVTAVVWAGTQTCEPGITRYDDRACRSDHHHRDARVGSRSWRSVEGQWRRREILPKSFTSARWMTKSWY